MSQLSKRLQKLECQRGSRYMTHEACLDFIDGRLGGMTEEEFITKFGDFPNFSSMYSADELKEFAE